jgi:hypothetical protein
MAGFLLPAGLLWAADVQRVEVADAFLELHTGAGRGFPIYHVIERHHWIEIIKRKSDWVKVLSDEGYTGWVYIDQMELTLVAPGERAKLDSPDNAQFQQHTYDVAVLAGDFAGAAAMSVIFGANFNRGLSGEFGYTTASGNYTNSLLWFMNLSTSPFPDWYVSPFFSVGFGYMKNSPRQSFVFADETSDLFANVGIGARMYLTRRVYLRWDVRDYLVFIDDSNSGKFREWKLGFSFFF